jgi:hypothetical protein
MLTPRAFAYCRFPVSNGPDSYLGVWTWASLVAHLHRRHTPLPTTRTPRVTAPRGVRLVHAATAISAMKIHVREGLAILATLPTRACKPLQQPIPIDIPLTSAIMPDIACPHPLGRGYV